MNLLANAITMLVIAHFSVGKRSVKHHSGRMMGGITVDVLKYPYVVALGRNRSECTGIIYNAQTIITSCHCIAYAFNRRSLNEPIKSFSAEGFKIVAGVNSFDDRSIHRQESTAKTFIPHPKCMRGSFNAGVIKLDRPLNFGARVWSAPLSNKQQYKAQLLRLQKYFDTKCLRIGYGQGTSGVSNGFLKAGENIILEDQDCVYQLCRTRNGFSCQAEYFENNKLLCLRSMTSSQCLGDEGGPIVCYTRDPRQSLTVGISSGANGLCSPASYGVLQLATRMDAVYDIITLQDGPQG